MGHEPHIIKNSGARVGQEPHYILWVRMWDMNHTYYILWVRMSDMNHTLWARMSARQSPLHRHCTAIVALADANRHCTAIALAVANHHSTTCLYW
jgi:hypothetical protein